MAGKRRSLGERIEEQKAVVEKKTGELKRAKDKLKELQEQEKETLMAKAVKIAEEKGISVIDLLKGIK